MNLHRLSLLAVAVVVLAGCGGESEAQKAKDAAASKASSATCDAPALSGPTGLPSGFPEPDGVTYAKTATQGPTVVVDATYAGDIDSGYDAYQQAVDGAGYQITHKEKEEDDAEIQYSGGGTTGQIALRDACGESDKIAVHITNRPA
jgi:hypothetical protein